MILIRNAKILTMEERAYPAGGDILLHEGKIAAVGENLSVYGATEVDAHGMWALPGIVDPHCHIGMWEDGTGNEGADGNEMTDPVTPQLRAIDAINSMDRCFTEAYQHGVTCAATGPGSANVFGGQFVAMKTYGKYVDDMVIQEPLALKMALGENPKVVYEGKNRSPQTRMATAALMREAFVDAREYGRKMKLEDAEKHPQRDLKKEILAKALDGELLVKIHAHRADDILTALRIQREFGFRMSVEHCTEGHLILDKLKQAGVGCILGPLLCDRSKVELRNMDFRAPYLFYKAGVKFALMSDHPVIPLQYLLVQAAVAVREGLPEIEALKAVTINAAEVIGLGDRLGSIKPGKDADLALYDGHPLDARAHVKQVYVNGELVHEG